MSNNAGWQRRSDEWVMATDRSRREKERIKQEKLAQEKTNEKPPSSGRKKT